MMLAGIAMSMLASSVSATIYMDKFYDFLDDTSSDNMIKLAFWQFWGFTLPYFAGVLAVWLDFLWNGGVILETIDVDGTQTDIDYGTALLFVGIGNYKQLRDFFINFLPKLLLNATGLLSTDEAYSSLEDNLMTRLGISL